MNNVLIENDKPIFSEIKPAIEALEKDGVIIYCYPRYIDG